MEKRIPTLTSCYRLCKKCGLEWNVSGKYKKIRQYICPKCEYKERKKNNEHQKVADKIS